MSFVEDNKTWILPLLGLGAAAVVWVNVRTFTQPAPAGPEPQPTLETASAPQAAAAPPPSTGAVETLWDDLRPVTFVPADLDARAVLEHQALSSLRPEAFARPATPSALRPTGPEPGRSPRPSSITGAGAPVPAPPPDFLIEGPGGTQAWFDGQGYRTGQPLRGRPFTVQGIRIQPTPGVTLQGPSGSARRSTRPTPVPEVP